MEAGYARLGKKIIFDLPVADIAPKDAIDLMVDLMRRTGVLEVLFNNPDEEFRKRVLSEYDTATKAFMDRDDALMDHESRISTLEAELDRLRSQAVRIRNPIKGGA